MMPIILAIKAKIVSRICSVRFLNNRIAIKASALKKIDMSKPKQFKGEWDFYDLEYTLRAYETGFDNWVVPIILRHESPGELVGRDSWHQNRQVFANIHMFPMEIRDE